MIKKYKGTIILIVSLICIFQVYLYTMFPAFKNDDSPETITSAYTLGISHPPGYPLFTMAGKVFSLLPVGSPAFRINLFAIFLALIVLLLSYFIIRQITYYVFAYENKIINFSGIFILALSYIFWNQAIEAKGGIYILNLLFLAILMYLSIRLFKKFNIKYLYLMSFIYGLSLANHWPSMIILLPVFGYPFFIYRRKINRKNVTTILLFLLAGISPYLYLPLRGGTDGIFMFAARPNTWENFWWTILRTGYDNTESLPALQIFGIQIKEFFVFLFSNYSMLWILMLAGGYIINKRSKKLFYFYLSTVLIIIFAVVIYNRSNEGSLWVIDVFLMPSHYILVFFIIAGIYLIFKFFKQKVFQYAFISVVFAIILWMGYKNFEKNDSRYNYQAYDFGYNILKTMDKNSLYLCERDDYINPLYYIQTIEKQRQDIKLLPVVPLPSKWGIDNFIRKYGNISLKENNPAYNLNNIIGFFAGNNFEIYKGSATPNMDSLKLEYNFKQTGLLRKYLKSDKTMQPKIFELYSYNRELYDKYIDYSRLTSGLVMNYPYCISMQGNELLMGKNPSGALQLYKKAMLFPFKYEIKENEPFFYYNISAAYKELNDKGNRIKYLEKAILLKENFWQAYQELGGIYFNDGNLPIAREMFEKAIQYGSTDRQALEQMIFKINQDMGNIQ